MHVVVYHREFASEAGTLEPEVQDAITAHAIALELMGHELGRPRADTLNGSRYSKMKELRPTVSGVEWRIAYAFDSEQVGILLAGGSKNGIDQDRFYRDLIAKADERLTQHEKNLAARSKVRAATAKQKSSKGKKASR